MKSCPSAVELERWLAEDRGDAEGGGITAHLEECPRCQEFMEQALRGAECPTLSAHVPGTLEAVGALDVPLMQHPHIVQVYEIGECDGGPFLALEYVPDGSLAQRLNGNPQPVGAAAKMTALIARAVHFAHKNGIVHRDLKPANILLVSSGVVSGGVVGDNAHRTTHYSLLTTHQPKITDFGLTKWIDRS